jgi:hypothetical protein
VTVGRRLLARVAAGRDDPTTLALLVVLAFSAGAATQALGPEAILGAFVGGGVTGETDSLDPSAFADASVRVRSACSRRCFSPSPASGSS